MSISTFVGRSWLVRSLAAATAFLTLTTPVQADVTPLADQPILVADVPAKPVTDVGLTVNCCATTTVTFTVVVVP